jgi:hypothetical protein
MRYGVHPLQTDENSEDLRRAARILARALIGENPTPGEIERFEKAVRTRAPSIQTACERRLWELAMRGPVRASLVDAGLALSDPHSPVRLRMCLMLAILEASPHHVGRYMMPDRWNLFTPFVLAFRGMLAVVRAGLGLLLVRIYGAFPG